MIKIGFGYDSHKLVEGRPFVLGGVEIPFAKGLLGHSDADVLLHAIIDALIGALGKGDIGRLFPDSDMRYKDIDSSILLAKVVALMRAENFFLNNIDASIILEEPKLNIYIDAMCENIAKIVGVSCSVINIKAKTNEKMGFIGRGEGIVAFAVLTITRGQ
ncbi:MAG: 2-C-methyl-D-erythritol 2,4-cyclodiphosphate synthase [Deltaproteobacteria bacterium]